MKFKPKFNNGQNIVTPFDAEYGSGSIAETHDNEDDLVSDIWYKIDFEDGTRLQVREERLLLWQKELK